MFTKQFIICFSEMTNWIAYLRVDLRLQDLASNSDADALDVTARLARNYTPSDVDI